MIQINAPFTTACDGVPTLTRGGVEDPMNCRIQYDFITGTRTVLDGATPLCAGGQTAAPEAVRPDVLRPNGEAERLVERHAAMLAALAAHRPVADSSAAWDEAA